MLMDKKVIVSKRKIKKLNWGIAGGSKVVQNEFLPALNQISKSKFVSQYSHNLERASFLVGHFNGEKAYSNFDEFLNSEIDAVYIASATCDHYWQAIKAIEKGKHVLCEIPAVIEHNQLNEIEKLCKKHNVQFAVNYHLRYNPLLTKARELIKKGLIGKIVSINASYNISMPPSSSFRFKLEKSGGGAVMDLGSTVMDILLFLGGKAEFVCGITDQLIYNIEVDDFASAVIKFTNSGYGYMNVSYNTEKAFNRIEVIGHKGSLCLEGVLAKRNKTGKLTIDVSGESKKVFKRRTNKMNYAIKAIQQDFLSNRPTLNDTNIAAQNLSLIKSIQEN